MANSRVGGQVTQLLLPAPGRKAAESFVEQHLSAFVDGQIEGSLRYTGGSSQGRRLLDQFDVSGYASRMFEVSPQRRRAASGLSPYLRHGLLSLGEVWRHVEDGPDQDVDAFRQHLLWSEYARHWYARMGLVSNTGLRRDLQPPAEPTGWNRDMACLEMTIEELEEEGWAVGRARSWLASYWAAAGGPWTEGEDFLFRHLLDGSRASNRLGWQDTLGLAGNKPFHFNRWQVEKWAAGLCASCDLVRSCPVETPPPHLSYVEYRPPVEASVDVDLLETAGPPTPQRRSEPEAVWITAESMGPADPALIANPDLPAVFVFDAPLLSQLRLSPKRLVFMVENLAELSLTRRVEVRLGNPAIELAGQAVAVTFAPVPGFRRRAKQIAPAEIHPWPWLLEPTTGSVASFREWRRSVDAASPLSQLPLSRPVR